MNNASTDKSTDASRCTPSQKGRHMNRRDFVKAAIAAPFAAAVPVGALAGLAPALNVYRLNDYEWFIAPTLQSAIEKWKDFTGLNDEDLDDPKQLTEEELDTMKFCHTDEDESPTHSITFRERVAEMIAEGTTDADFFATTEY
jgi:hypothetical protein